MMKDYLVHNRLVGLICIAVLILSACKEEKPVGYHTMGGETMGTYYALNYEVGNEVITREEVDKVLEDVNLAFSTYIKKSYVSKFNRSGKGIALPRHDTMTKVVFQTAEKYYNLSDGYYDPTIMPLVNFWGFGYEDVDKKDIKANRKVIDSLLEYVSLDSIEYIEHNGFSYLRKLKKGMQLDFSSIAKGYGIDVVAHFLEQKGVRNYLVDIGGEAKARGLNADGNVWRIAINKPKENSKITDVELVLVLDDKSIATSGNYRNVYEVDGKKYSHTINPRTGLPERTKLLSASVIADDCIDADAIATTLMVLGLDKGKKFLDKLDKVEACLIYDEDGDDVLERFTTEGFKEYLVSDN